MAGSRDYLVIDTGKLEMPFLDGNNLEAVLPIKAEFVPLSSSMEDMDNVTLPASSQQGGRG